MFSLSEFIGGRYGHADEKLTAGGIGSNRNWGRLHCNRITGITWSGEQENNLLLRYLKQRLAFDKHSVFVWVTVLCIGPSNNPHNWDGIMMNWRWCRRDLRSRSDREEEMAPREWHLLSASFAASLSDLLTWGRERESLWKRSPHDWWRTPVRSCSCAPLDCLTKIIVY